MRHEAGLDDPVRASLVGRHANLARSVGRVVTFDPDVSTFCSVPTDPGPQDWADVVRLLGPDALLDLFTNPAVPPPHWEPVFAVDGQRMVADQVEPAPDVLPDGVELVELGLTDRSAMLDLVARVQPGPFWPRTPELGTYLGIRERGVLVAMAGERLQPPGWTEISAVCTAPEARGRGHASLLVRALAGRIARRGDRAFLHVTLANPGAFALYRRLGFIARTAVTFRGFRTPPGP